MNEDDIEHPAEIQFSPVWVLKLDAADTLTVLKALGGRLQLRNRDGENEVEKARQLGDRLTAMRAHHARRFSANLERAAEQAGAK
jgi:hypothetical protein